MTEKIIWYKRISNGILHCLQILHCLPSQFNFDGVVGALCNGEYGISLQNLIG